MALTRELVARQHQVTVVCRPDAWIAEQLAGEPVEIIRSDLHRWPTDELRRLSRIIRDRGIQLLHTHMTRAHTVGVLLRWATGRPCIASAHCRHLHPHWCLNDYVVANSEATRRFHCRWNLVAPRRIEVVPCLVDTDRFDRVPLAACAAFRRSLGVTWETPLFGIIGDVRRCKGHVYLVRALPEILARIPAARLLIVGNRVPGYAAQVQREAERLGVADRMLWQDYRDDIDVVTKSLDLCVSAALEEPLGLTVPEAMGAGRAVVATRVGGLPENVVDGQTGLLVPPADPHALGQAIIRLLADPPLRNRMGATAWHVVRRRYCTERALDRWQQIFRDTIPACVPGRRALTGPSYAAAKAPRVPAPGVDGVLATY
jgi:glycosyltransferase involved in cell wall biosynthesis